ncbi:hypothetical protein GCM10009625_24030 [Brachybacterium fresconis]
MFDAARVHVRSPGSHPGGPHPTPVEFYVHPRFGAHCHLSRNWPWQTAWENLFDTTSLITM